MSTFSREHFIETIRQLRATLPDFSPEKTAVNKAALNLDVNANWQWDGITLKIESATVSRRTYYATADTCTCPARGQCWHRASAQVLRRAELLARQTDPAKRGIDDEAYAALCDEVARYR